MVAASWAENSALDHLDESDTSAQAQAESPATKDPESPTTGQQLSPADRLHVVFQQLLDRITASNGNNETAIVGRFQLQTEYREVRSN